MNPYRIAPPAPPRPDPDATLRLYMLGAISFSEHFDCALADLEWHKRCASETLEDVPRSVGTEGSLMMAPMRVVMP